MKRLFKIPNKIDLKMIYTNNILIKITQNMDQILYYLCIHSKEREQASTDTLIQYNL